MIYRRQVLAAVWVHRLHRLHRRHHRI